MTICCQFPRLVFYALLSISACASGMRGQVTFYSGTNANANWLAAAGGTPVVLNFESIAAGVQANSPAFLAYAASAGIVFRPFGNGAFPQADHGNGGIGAVGPRWLGNAPSTGSNPANSISWTFNQPIRAFGFYDVGSDDGFEVIVYSTSLVSLGSFNTAEESGMPLFWGFIANQDIGQVDIRPRVGNGYIGIDGIATIAIPEPSTAALLAGLGVLVVAGGWRFRRRAAVVEAERAV